MWSIKHPRPSILGWYCVLSGCVGSFAIGDPLQTRQCRHDFIVWRVVPPGIATIHTDKDATNGTLMMCSLDGITRAQGWTCFFFIVLILFYYHYYYYRQHKHGK